MKWSDENTLKYAFECVCKQTRKENVGKMVSVGIKRRIDVLTLKKRGKKENLVQDVFLLYQHFPAKGSLISSSFY